MKVKGNGYTDHCPACLWGRHVDVNPGDRAAGCGGMMKPARVFKKGDGYAIEYVCEKCGHEFRVKAAPEDNFELILKLSSFLSLTKGEIKRGSRCPRSSTG